MSKPNTSHNELETTYPETSQSLDALIRAGARRMLIAALEAEVEAYIEQHAHLRDEKGPWWCATARQGPKADGAVRGRQFENPCAAGA